MTGAWCVLLPAARGRREATHVPAVVPDADSLPARGSSRCDGCRTALAVGHRRHATCATVPALAQRRWHACPGARVCLTTGGGTDSRLGAGWSSLAAREAHNLEVGGSHTLPAMLARAHTGEARRFPGPRLTRPSTAGRDRRRMRRDRGRRGG